MPLLIEMEFSSHCITPPLVGFRIPTPARNPNSKELNTRETPGVRLQYPQRYQEVEQWAGQVVSAVSIIRPDDPTVVVSTGGSLVRCLLVTV